jgi:hypothetical protein
MSGGSFNYACTDLYDLDKVGVTWRNLDDMKTYCEGYIPEALPQLDDMIKFIEAFSKAYSEKCDRIEGLVKAIEWEKSCDWGADDVRKEVKKIEESNQ